MKPFAACAAANCLTVWPPLTRVSLVAIPSAASAARCCVGRGSAGSRRRARVWRWTREVDALLVQRTELGALDDGGVHLQLVAAPGGDGLRRRHTEERPPTWRQPGTIVA